MAILLTAIATIGYISLHILEPKGLKRFNSGRDIFFKSFAAGGFLAGMFCFLLSMDILGWAKVKGEFGKKNFNILELASSVQEIIIFEESILLLGCFLFLVRLLNRCWLDRSSLSYFLGESSKALYKLNKKFVLVNVKPNKLYFAFLESMWDTDDIKGVDLIGIKPVSVSFYDDKGYVHLAREYFDTEALRENLSVSVIEHNNTILLKYSEVSQIREYDEDLCRRFERSTHAYIATSIRREEAVREMSDLFDRLLEVADSLESENKFLLEDLIGRIDINLHLKLDSKREYVSHSELVELASLAPLLDSFIEKTEMNQSGKILEAKTLVLSIANTIEGYKDCSLIS